MHLASLLAAYSCLNKKVHVLKGQHGTDHFSPHVIQFIGFSIRFHKIPQKRDKRKLNKLIPTSKHNRVFNPSINLLLWSLQLRRL